MIDEAMLRPGRLEKLVYVGLPKPEERVDILKALSRQRKVISLDIAEFARQDACAGYSGADLASLLRNAGLVAFKRQARCIEEQDIVMAADRVKPSVRELAKYEALRKEFEKDV